MTLEIAPRFQVGDDGLTQNIEKFNCDFGP
jgi:hypothetical protein